MPPTPNTLRAKLRGLTSGPRRRYALIAFGGQLTQAALLFAGAVLAARLLGPAGKGELTGWVLAMTLAGAVLAGRVPGGMGISFLSSHPELRPALRRHLGLSGALVLPAAAIGLAAGLDPLPTALVGLIGIPCTVVLNDLLGVTTAAKRAAAGYMLRVTRPAMLAVGLGVAALAADEVGVETAYALVAAGAALTVVLGMRIGSALTGAETLALRTAAERGEGTWLARVNSLLIRRLDYLVVLIVSGPASLGVYSVAVNIGEMTQHAGTAMSQAVFENETTLDNRQARRLLRSSVSLLGPVSLLVLAAGILAIEPVFGAEFSDARLPALLLAPGIVALGPATMAGSILVARGRGPRLARLTTMIVLAGVPVWFGATLAFGIEGAAAASSLVYAAQAVFSRRLLLEDPAPATG